MTPDAVDEQIVVVSEHLPTVLAGTSGSARPVRSDPRLGLTLVELTDVPALADRIDAERASVTGSTCRVDDGPLDRVLGGLRAISEHRCGGWAPGMGKNRTVSGVQFKPYSNAGGFDRPEPAEAPEQPRGLPRGRRRVRVGVLDTRLEPHSRLVGRCLTDGDALAETKPGEQRFWWEGHATFISGVVLAAAPAADLDVRTALVPPVGPDEGWTMPLWDLAVRLAEFRDSGVEVLNLSLGCSTRDGKPPMVLQRAIDLLTPSMVVVAAAGNHGTASIDTDRRAVLGMPAAEAPLFPAALDNVLAVGALDGDGYAEFNPSGGPDGRPAPWIDVFAPGVGVVSSYLGDGAGTEVQVPVADDPDRHQPVAFAGWASWTGTSFAAAHVTGRIAAEISRGATSADAIAAVHDEWPR